jgi:hypothetical protein
MMIRLQEIFSSDGMLEKLCPWESSTFLTPLHKYLRPSFPQSYLMLVAHAGVVPNNNR